MSQFSRKYYNLDYKRNAPKEELPERTIWEFWHVWGLFECAVITLLLLILFSLFTLCGTPTKSFTHTLSKENSFHLNDSKTLKQQEDGELSLLGKEYPKKVLPASVLPPRTKEDPNTYGPLSIQNYLYFVDATDAHYPDFIDKSSRRILKNKAPRCSKPECPLRSGVREEDLHSYLEWVETQSQKKLQLVKKDGLYYLREEKE